MHFDKRWCIIFNLFGHEWHLLEMAHHLWLKLHLTGGDASSLIKLNLMGDDASSLDQPEFSKRRRIINDKVYICREMTHHHRLNWIFWEMMHHHCSNLHFLGDGTSSQIWLLLVSRVATVVSKGFLLSETKQCSIVVSVDWSMIELDAWVGWVCYILFKWERFMTSFIKIFHKFWKIRPLRVVEHW